MHNPVPCLEIQSSAQRESDEIQPFQDINLPSIGQLQSCSSLDDFCRAVTGLSLKDFHERYGAHDIVTVSTCFPTLKDTIRFQGKQR